MGETIAKIFSDWAKVSVVLVITLRVSLSFLTSLFLVAINLSISSFGGQVIISFISSNASAGFIFDFSIIFWTSLIP